jgi:RhtB (resistance to homoserine/threonine) family protein
MLGIHDFGIFMATGILLNLTPGQDTLYILGRSLAQGRRIGLASVLGISSGAIIHTLAAALGLSALIAASAPAFAAIRWLGAGYLVYLGLKMFLSRATPGALPASLSGTSSLAAFRQGMLTNLLNPKVILFYLAFMPQFITPGSPNQFPAFLLLGLCFIATGTSWCLCVVLFASALGKKLKDSRTFAEMLNRAAGALFVFLGLKLALSD